MLPQISLSDMEYTTKTAGWVNNLEPYWRGQIERQKAKVRLEERNLREGKESKVQYELGVLDGLEIAANAVDNIRKGFQLRNRVSRT